MGNRINYDYIETYIDQQTSEGSLLTSSPRRQLLEQIRASAQQQGLPILRTQLEAFLRWQIACLKPQNILEIGTCIGYSAIAMMDSAPAACKLTTIAQEEDVLRIARSHFAQSSLEDRIVSFCGDSGEILPCLLYTS